MKLKKALKSIQSKLSFPWLLFTLPAVAISSTVTYLGLPNVFDSEHVLTEPMIHQVALENQSHIDSKYMDGLLANLHDDFKINIVHDSGRKESLNKSQYRKHFEMISLFDMDYSSSSEIINIMPVSKSRALVTIIVNQSFTNEKYSFLDHENTNYQTMLIANDSGEVKILEVNANVRGDRNLKI
jgi:hypothetical protein